MNSHCMIDLETLATSYNASILTIGAVRFDPYGNDLVDSKMESLYLKIDPESCSRIGLVTCDDTLAWWATQGDDAQEDAFSDSDRVDIVDAFNQLYKFCWGASTVWSHGNTLDIVVCEHVFKTLQKACPWKYFNVRCSRTLFNLGIDPKLPTEIIKHNSLYDAWAQAVGVQNVFRTLKSFGVERIKK